MHMRWFGDSYDIVKQQLIRWLEPFGEWAVHPMLTESASEGEVDAFQRFIGARVISTDVLTSHTQRESYFSCAMGCKNLFLDPDTGLKIGKKQSPSPKHLFEDDLVYLCDRRPKSLTLVFDQSLGRGRREEDIGRKLSQIEAEGISCVAYVSHACFILCSRDKELTEKALKTVITKSRLPEGRFLRGEAYSRK